MINLKKAFYVVLFINLFFITCDKIDSTPEVNSKVISVEVIHSSDNSGKVTFTPQGEDVKIFEINFGDSTKSETVLPNKSITHIYNEEKTYEVFLSGMTHTGTRKDTTLKVAVTYVKPTNMEVSITIDTLNLFKVYVQAKAQLEESFEVYFKVKNLYTLKGLKEDSTVSFTYADTGFYNIKVVALTKGAATSERTDTVHITNKKIIIPVINDTTTTPKDTVKPIVDKPTPSSEFVKMLTNDTNKTWAVDFEIPGHFGVGSLDRDTPELWSAGVNDKANVGIYDDRYNFTKAGVFTHKTNNTIFGKGKYLTDFDPALSVDGDYTLTGNSAADYSESVTYEVQDSKEYINFSTKGHMGLYLGSHKYEVLNRTNDKMYLRYIGKDNLAWYVKIKAVSDNINPPPPPVEPEPPIDRQLVWADEFDVDGAPNPANWKYDIGGWGWGNGEAQYYTDRTDNAIVSNGILKINLKKESYMGSNYTSARLLSHGKFSFKYGKISVRAKLPVGGGTWPAIWMLGDNFYPNKDWPACGEIDIMEQVGNNANNIYGTLHYTGHFGGGGPSKQKYISTSSTEFHVYSVDWTATQIKFYIDDELFHTYTNDNTTPFHAKFFILLNVAMGGGFGGAIDPNFQSSSMEIDYVRVYQ